MANMSSPGDGSGINWGQIGGAAGSATGSAIGQADSEDEKRQIYNNLVAQYAAASGIDVSKVGAADPRLRQAQMKALTQLQGLSDAGGLDPQAQAMEAQGQRDASAFEKGQRGAILQDAQARGVGGGGAELAAQLQAQQAGANRSAIVGQQSAAAARARALQAMSEYATLAGGIRNQDEGDAKDAFGAGMQKYGAQRDARQGLNNYYGADRAEKIGNSTANGQAAGQVLGALGQGAASGLGKGGGSGGEGRNSGGSGGQEQSPSAPPLVDAGGSDGGFNDYPGSSDGGGYNDYPGSGGGDDGDIGGDGGWGSNSDPFRTVTTDPNSALAKKKKTAAY